MTTANKLNNGDLYLGREGSIHMINSEGYTVYYNNEEMVMIYGKGWGHKLS